MSLTTGFLAIIASIFFFGILIHLQAVSILQRWVDHIRSYTSAARGNAHDIIWFAKMEEEYRDFRLKTAEEPNTGVLIERYLYSARVKLLGIFPVPVGNLVRFQSQLPSAAIIFGLLGTFTGLTLALYSMQDLLGALSVSSGTNLTIDTLVAALIEPFQGMSLAFITSIAGISAALLLTLFQNGFFNSGKSVTFLIEEVAAASETVLDYRVSADVTEEKPRDYLEKVFDRFVGKVQESFDRSVGTFSEKMVGFTESLNVAMDRVQNILKDQETASRTFSESAGSLKEFGDSISSSFERAGRLTHSLEQSAGSVSKGLASLEQTIKGQDKAAEQMQRRFEHLVNRSDEVIKSTDQRVKELNSQYLRGLDEQLARSHEQQEALERRSESRQDEWYRRLQENQDSYYRSAQEFSGSVNQLEKAWYETVERLKRDLFDQLSRERQQSQQFNSFQDDRNEWIRALERMTGSLHQDAAQIHRDLQEVYELIHRAAESSRRHSGLLSADESGIRQRFGSRAGE
ncbi:hypothetical protein [Bacillus marinisedimentorum]|uniref:hypothetical protein n=1 Tax=Bacillus marinisedimentorum TaxID=1821260 RepID=UPI000873228E|nr:hypothetical protein [Bacillus marinisedimentorum]